MIFAFLLAFFVRVPWWAPPLAFGVILPMLLTAVEVGFHRTPADALLAGLALKVGATLAAGLAGDWAGRLLLPYRSAGSRSGPGISASSSRPADRT